MNYGVALTFDTNKVLKNHLLREDGDEDLCYAIWYPSLGAKRMSALVCEPILPEEGDRKVHGNASTTGDYLGRAIKLAMEKGAGVAFMHSHPYPGWQGMSGDDIRTEQRQAAAVKAATGLPLVGMTLGTDGAWSARFWIKTAPKTYKRFWCESVRVLGEKGLEVTFNDRLMPPPAFREELKRTISAWGEKSQQKLARLRFGVIGVGSVGSAVAESLARMGVQHIKLVDFDRVEKHNLDRLLHATSKDAKAKRLKIDVIGEGIRKSATAAAPHIEGFPLAVTEEDGFREALDCDLLFSCVDRPWPRHVLNYIAYAHLIPVVDGGILIRIHNDRMRQASWRSHVAYPGRRCIMCVGQYDASLVNVERRGDLDDPTYIEGLPDDHTLKRNENVFPFSAHLASSLIMHAIHVALNPVGISDVGAQIYHFVDGSLDVERGQQCEQNCDFPKFVGKGDAGGLPVTGVDIAAAKARAAYRAPQFITKLISRFK